MVMYISSEAEVIPIHKTSEELIVQVGDLRTSKDRPPTPMVR